MFEIETWRTFNILFTAVGQTLFISFYLTLPWWRTFLGRALFVKSMSFALLVDVAVLGRIYEWPYEDATFVVLYGLVGIGAWGQFIAFVKQGRDRHQPADDHKNLGAEHDHTTA